MTSRKNILIHSICIAVLSIASALVIFYQFPHVPQNLSYDETEFARLALSLENTGYIPYSPLATGHPTLYFYIILASIKLFGLSVFSLRLPSALFGILGTAAFYLLIQQIFSNGYLKRMTNSTFLLTHDYFMPTLLTFIFLTTRWYFNFARFSFEATFLLFLELLSFWFFLMFRNTKAGKYLIGSGVFAGLAYNSYTPGRLFFIIPLFFLLTKLIAVKQFQMQLVKPLILFIVPFIIIIAPLTIYLSIHNDIRINQLSYVTNDKMEVGEKISFAIQNVQKTALMFHASGDMNGRHNYPGKATLNPIAGLFFVLGLLYSLKKYKQFENSLFLIYFVLSLVPMMLTYPWENPNILRSFTTIPAIVFFIGNAILLFFNLPIKTKYLIYAFCIVFYLAAVYDIRTYFVYMSHVVFPSAFEIDPLLFPAYIKGMYEWLYQFDTMQ